jgi:uncharacterized membrane protein YjfL (UPF0719 family)
MTTTSEQTEIATTNHARRLARVGLLVALGVLLPSVLRPCLTLHPTRAGFASAGLYTVAGLLALALSTLGWNRALLRGRLRTELARGNLAAGIVAGAHVAGTGIVASHCFVADTPANLVIGAIFFVVAEVACVLLSLLFRALTAYADDQEICGQNLAAGLSYSGLVVALALIVGHAADGAFVEWLAALRAFAVFLLWALLLYPVRQIVVARLLLGLPVVWRGGALDRAVAQQHDWIVSSVEAAGYLAAALLATGIS